MPNNINKNIKIQPTTGIKTKYPIILITKNVVRNTVGMLSVSPNPNIDFNLIPIMIEAGSGASNNNTIKEMKTKGTKINPKMVTPNTIILPTSADIDMNPIMICLII